MYSWRCPTLSLLLAFNGPSTQEGIIYSFLGSRLLFYYTIRMKEISTSIEKTLTMVIDACTLSPEIDFQFECFVAGC
jgi:hypothetical protein